MKQLLYLVMVLVSLSACKKSQDGIDLYPIFYPTDMLFEDLKLDRFSQSVPANSFTTSIATFNVRKDNSDWGGFAISNRNLRTFVQSAASVDSTIFSAYTGTFPHAGGNFLVVRPTGDDAKISFSRPIQIEKMLVTNTTHVYQAIMYGEGATVGGKQVYTFAPGTTMLSVAKKSYVKIIIKGYNGEKETGEVSFLLADRQSDEKKRNFTITDWMPVSLDSLGKVTSVVFYMDSSDKTAGVMNTPAYFCLDGIRFKENIY